MSGDQLLGDQLSGDQLSGDQLSGDQLSGDQLSGDQLSGINCRDQLSGDQLSRYLIYYCHVKSELLNSQKEQKSKVDSEVSDESESNIDDFDVDPNVMSNVNAVIENGVLEVSY